MNNGSTLEYTCKVHVHVHVHTLIISIVIHSFVDLRDGVWCYLIADVTQLTFLFSCDVDIHVHVAGFPLLQVILSLSLPP